MKGVINMASRQHASDFSDQLEKLSDEQLRAFLNEELHSEDADDQLIRHISHLLAAREEAAPEEAEAAYQEFLEQVTDTEPLFDELEQEMAGFEGSEDGQANPRRGKVLPVRRLARTGLLVAVLAALLLAGYAVAGAMGFQLGTKQVSWDGDTMAVSDYGLLSDLDQKSSADDPYFALRTALAQDGYGEKLVPHYLPAGYSAAEYERIKIDESNVFYHARFRSGEKLILVIYQFRSPTANIFYPKDDGEPEIYIKNGIEHYITTNVGEYRAVWSNSGLICEIHCVPTREELIRMIDSIYS